MEEAADTADEDKAFKILQHIIPDLVINGRSLSGNGMEVPKKRRFPGNGGVPIFLAALTTPNRWYQSRKLAKNTP